MINKAMDFLKAQLNERLKTEAGVDADDLEAERDVVVYIDGEKMEPLIFTLGTVSLLLVNIEQEKTMRRAEPHRTVDADNTPQLIAPEIRLELSLLFVAHFKQYNTGLKTLSDIVQFFQEKPLFLRANYPELPADIERLSIEPRSLPLSEQNEIWSALRVTYRPSLLYRVRMLVFKDRLPKAAPPVTEAVGTVVRKKALTEQD
jgi:hypothetical protein